MHRSTRFAPVLLPSQSSRRLSGTKVSTASHSAETWVSVRCGAASTAASSSALGVPICQSHQLPVCSASAAYTCRT
ncbi:UNVERIFIED_ORG: hypothetical protein FHR35_005314 [Microbispora rosea subsp. rosea]